MKRNEEDLKKLIINNINNSERFLLYYQPIYSTKQKKYTKTEVLLRMLDDTDKIVMPDEFIPYSEKSNLITDIGYIVIEKLCIFIDSYKINDILFSVNISPIQIEIPNFAQKCLDIFQKYNINKNKIIFELTESSKYDINKTIIKNIEILHKNGISISLDDMGKGSSDLNKANSLPIDYIKIDKIYIDKIDTPSVFRLIKALIMFSQSKKVKTVAEGVETIEQKNILEKLHCEYLQGYFFSKPLSQKDFIGVI